jgi:hypothetical protein
MSWKEVLEIRSQIGQLEAKKRDAVKRLDEAALRHMGLCIGDRIIATRFGDEFECSVIGVADAAYSRNPRPSAMRVKKDGTVGTQSAGYIGEWRKKEQGND